MTRPQKHKCFIKIKYDPYLDAYQFYIFCFVCYPYDADYPEEEPIELYFTPFWDYALYTALEHYVTKSKS